MKKIKKVITLLTLIFPLTINAQDGKGIKFQKGLRWDAIQSKAKAENKYLFVDCFATWCVPCKQMDKEVYSNDTVGNFFNANFISVKVQMDKTNADSDAVKKWYADAEMIDQKYTPQGYPTFLFFAPDGKIVYKGLGYQNVNGLIKLAKFATDPKRRDFYSQLEDYKNGKKNYASMPELVKITKEVMGDKELSASIAKDYKVNYLDKLPDEKLFTRETLQFIGQDFKLINSSDRIFKMVYQKPLLADTLANRKGFSRKLIDYIINKEEIEDKIWNNNQPVTKKPEWSKIRSTIIEKYVNCNADTLVSAARVSFYKRIKNWKEYVNTVEDLVKKYPPTAGGKKLSGALGGVATIGPDAWGLNGVAWELFLECTDKNILKKALRWSELSLNLDNENDAVQYYDTKANLQYKLGKTKEAIASEEKAIELLKGILKGAKSPLTETYFTTIEKMEKGIPTWKEN